MAAKVALSFIRSWNHTFTTCQGKKSENYKWHLFKSTWTSGQSVSQLVKDSPTQALTKTTAHYGGRINVSCRRCFHWLQTYLLTLSGGWKGNSNCYHFDNYTQHYENFIVPRVITLHNRHDIMTTKMRKKPRVWEVIDCARWGPRRESFAEHRNNMWQWQTIQQKSMP